MKRLIINLVAFLIISFGGLALTTSNAAPNQSIQYGPSCLDMGCIGGNLDCYSPPGGGMCYTGGDPEKE